MQPPADVTVNWQASLHRFEVALENMSHGICFFDGAQRLILANSRYAELYDLSPAQLQPGITLRAVIDLRFAAGTCPRMSREEYHAWRDAIAVRNTASESVVELMNGRTIAIKHRPMPDGGWVATHEDVTEQRRSAAQIIHLAHHDPLTGLANRMLFQARLEEAFEWTGRGERFAILCVDLDRFKEVNDAHGHPVGDLLLRAVTARLAAEVREGDTVSRLGGDEFAIIQRRIDAPQDAAALARRVIDTLSAPYPLAGHQVMIGASIGVALAPQDGTDADLLLKNADTALYRAKTDGRGCCRFFEAEMNVRMQVRRSLEADLRRALEAGELEVHYQPCFAVPSRRAVGLEALLRWRHPERGLVMPQSFIPLAEESGLIVPIGDWVLREACAVAATLPAAMTVAVNLSPAQFASPGLAERIATALRDNGLGAGRLELEITESIMLQDSEAVLDTLHRLRGLGVGIAMDDFGTGYSSLSALQRFPFTRVKIDRSFVRDLGQSRESGAIVQAIARLCRVLGMATTAEGVETEAQFRAVAACGCTDAQGYLLGRPAPMAELRRLWARDRRPVTNRRRATAPA